MAGLELMENAWKALIQEKSLVASDENYLQQHSYIFSEE